jgi:hypothetical protein
MLSLAVTKGQAWGASCLNKLSSQQNCEPALPRRCNVLHADNLCAMHALCLLRSSIAATAAAAAAIDLVHPRCVGNVGHGEPTPQSRLSRVMSVKCAVPAATSASMHLVVGGCRQSTTCVWTSILRFAVHFVPSVLFSSVMSILPRLTTPELVLVTNPGCIVGHTH